MVYIWVAIYLFLFLIITLRKFHFGLILLFTLLPLYLVRFHIGPLPSTLLEAMIIILILGYIIKEKPTLEKIKAWKKQLKQQPTIIIAIVLFVLGATISVLTSLNFKAAAGEWKAFYIEPIIIFIITIASLSHKSTRSKEKTMDIIQYILFGLILAGLTTSLLAIYQHFTGFMVPYDFWQNKNTFRVTAWYGFPNAVGLFLAPLLPISIYLIKQSWNKIKTKKRSVLVYTMLIASLLFIPCSILAIWYAKSTAAIIGIMAGIGLLLLFYKKTRLPVIAIAIVGITTIAIMPINNPIKQELLLQDKSGQLRINMWAETTQFLMHNPIKGAGLASYQELIYSWRIDKWVEVFHHPHNIFLTMWINLGIIGLIGFVWILVWFYKTGFVIIIKKANKLNNDKIDNQFFIKILLSAMTIIITMGLVDSPYIKNDLALLFWLLPALLVLQTKNK